MQRIRGRASLFMPASDADAQALRFGMAIPVSGNPAANAEIDGAWNDELDSMNGALKDFFDVPVAGAPAVGASQNAWDSQYSRYMNSPDL